MKNNKFSGLKNIVAVFLMFSIFVTTSMVVLAKPETQSLSAEITFSRNVQAGETSSVKLNGEEIASGRTFFSSGEISTPEKSSATINLGKLGYLTMEPNTILKIELSENKIGGIISTGNVQVFNNDGVAVNIETTGNASVKSAKQTGQGGAKGNVVVLSIIFAAIVGGALIYTLTNGDDDNVLSPVR